MIPAGKATRLPYWRADFPNKVDLHVAALAGPTADPHRRVTTANAPRAEVGPGRVATWRVGERDHAVGFDRSHEHGGGSSKHFPFGWRPETEGASSAVSAQLQRTTPHVGATPGPLHRAAPLAAGWHYELTNIYYPCLLYTSDAADAPYV